jgi:hypothetical protein
MFKSFENHDLMVKNISANITEDILFGTFSDYGKIISVKIMKDAYTQTPRGFAFVTFGKRHEGKFLVFRRFLNQLLFVLVEFLLCWIQMSIPGCRTPFFYPEHILIRLA